MIYYIPIYFIFLRIFVKVLKMPSHPITFLRIKYQKIIIVIFVIY